MALEDWTTVDGVVDEVVEAMGLSDMRKVYRPVLHGVDWLGDVRRIVLRMYKLEALGFKLLRHSPNNLPQVRGGLAEGF